MNNQLKTRIINALSVASKTYQQLADAQKNHGRTSSANETMVHKVRIDSLINEVSATIKESPLKTTKPKAKKKPAKR